MRRIPLLQYDELFRLLVSGSIESGQLVRCEVSLSNMPNWQTAMTDYETTGVGVVAEF